MNKEKQHWTWHALEPKFRCIASHVSRKLNRQFLCSYNVYCILFNNSFCSDGFYSYVSNLPVKVYCGKRYTQRIERANFTLQTRFKRLAK
ncbi:IS1 family transposase [Vibrio profundum]|uniref:IS1 family transposase n=1 Tax=Vibrio profundum TaxID=2910247 RepID=UPI003D0F8FD2